MDHKRKNVNVMRDSLYINTHTFYLSTFEMEEEYTYSIYFTDTIKLQSWERISEHVLNHLKDLWDKRLEFKLTDNLLNFHLLSP